jgi:hypothetical protein
LDASDAARAVGTWTDRLARERRDRDQADADDHREAADADVVVDPVSGLPRVAAWQVTAARAELARASEALQVLAAGTTGRGRPGPGRSRLR